MKEIQSIVSNLWVKQIELEGVGDDYAGHTHTFDHQHLLAVGSIRVRIGEDIVADYTAPCFIFIEKDSMHSLESLSDSTIGYCVHPIRNGNRVEDIYAPEDKPKYKQKTMMTYEDGEESVFEDSPVTKWDNKDAEL